MIAVSDNLASSLEGTSAKENNGTFDQQCPNSVDISSTGHLVKASENLSEKLTDTKRSFDTGKVNALFLNDSSLSGG